MKIENVSRAVIVNIQLVDERDEERSKGSKLW